MKIYYLHKIPEIIFFDRTTQNFNEVVKHIKDMKKELCKRDDYNINQDDILKSLNSLSNPMIQGFGYCIYQDCMLYEKRTKRPIAILLAKLASSTKAYTIMVLCKHNQGMKGLARLLLDKLVEKAKQNNIAKIYTTPIPEAHRYYLNLGFEDAVKEEFTESSEDNSLYSYSIDVDKYNIQKGETKYKTHIVDSTSDMFKKGVELYDKNIVLDSSHKLIIVGDYLATLFIDEFIFPVGDMLTCMYLKYANLDVLSVLLDVLEECAHKNEYYQTSICFRESEEDAMNVLLLYGFKKRKLPHEFAYGQTYFMQKLYKQYKNKYRS